MSEPTESSETIAGCRVGILRAGQGAPLLFLHGARGASSWLPFFRALAHQFDVIVPEHPGFGRSETPPWLHDVGDLANFYSQFIEALGLEQVHLVGSSLGGWIAVELAARNAQPLASLTLLSAFGMELSDASFGDLFNWTPTQTVRNLFADPALVDWMLTLRPDDEERKRQLKNALTFERLSAQRRLCDAGLRARLPGIHRPTLLVWGDKDKVIPAQHGAAFRDLIPGARLELIDNCGHLPHVEKPAATAAIIAQFANSAR
jgi:pimeloyl-ACP methyl ester carboxylesterase